MVKIIRHGTTNGVVKHDGNAQSFRYRDQLFLHTVLFFKKRDSRQKRFFLDFHLFKIDKTILTRFRSLHVHTIIDLSAMLYDFTILFL